MRKDTKEELFKMDAVDVYKMVLKGDTIKAFPKGFWQQPEAKQNASKCTRYLIEEILKYDEKKIKEKNSKSIFSKNKLAGMLATCFNYSPYEVIDNAYPNKYKEWEFKAVPQGCWDNKENGIKATKWLIEEKLKLSDEELKKQLSQKLFKDNGLVGMLQRCFNHSPYEAINAAYPNKYKEWEFKMTPIGYWDNKENGIKAIKWLIEEKLKLSDKELKEQLSVNLFKDNGLGGMLQHCFNYSPYKAINTTYPNKYKEWEFKMTPIGYWSSKENGIKATKWLIEEKLKLSGEELKEQLSQKLFIENGLRGMLQHCFNSSPYEAINTAYPNRFKKSDFKGYN